MTISQVKDFIQSIGYPCTYYEFVTDEVPERPYVVWYFPQSADFSADGTNYQKIEQLNIELYSRTKDFDAEQRVERRLTEAGFSWTREEIPIPSESGFEVLYQTEVLLNG